MNKKLMFALIGLGILIAVFAAINPFAYNDPGNRTVVTTSGGSQFVKFESGVYYAGFFAKEAEFPNQISVSYIDSVPKYDLVDNTIDIGKISIRFNDKTTALVTGITQYVLPSGEKEMLEIYNTHKTPEALVKRRLAPYTQECLQSSGQLLSSEMHLSGGRAQMVQDYIDQLKNGAFLLEMKTSLTYDSTDKSDKITYTVIKQLDSTKQPKRKFSSIKEYEISVGDAQITDVDYEPMVDEKLKKIIDATTKLSISKQDLMTAQQQAQTAKALGEKKLVETEYAQKVNQTTQVVAAETQVKLAQQDLERQAVMEKAAIKEASKIKILADANAYEKQRDIQANGALEQKLAAYVEVQKAWAEAAKSSNWVPTYQSGGATSNGASNVSNMVDMFMFKSAKDLSLDTKTK